MEIKLSIVIVNYNTKKYIEGCLKSIYAYPPSCDFEVIVVDNNSQDGSTELITKKFPEAILVKNDYNLGFSKANNIGVKVSTGNFLLLLNSDTVVLKNSFDTLLCYLEHDKSTYVVGPQLLNHDYTLQRSFFNFPTPIKTLFQILNITPMLYPLKKMKIIRLLFKNPPAFLMDYKEVASTGKIDYLILAALAIKKDIYEMVGGLDENLFFYNEDSDLGYKLKKLKIDIKYLPESKVIHFGGSSSTVENVTRNYNAYFRGALYTAAKHEKFLFVTFFRLAIIIGSFLKIGMAIIGVKSICPIGIYGKSSPKKITVGILISTYLKMIKMSITMK